MHWAAVSGLVACGLLLLAWTAGSVIEARVGVGGRWRRRCTALQLAFFGALLGTGMALIAIGSQTGQRWVALLLIAQPFLVGLLWSSFALRRLS